MLGCFIDFVECGVCDLLDVEVMVFDEVDYMCDMGFLFVVSVLFDFMLKNG